MALEIVEILRRSTQGITEPFVCRADDDEIYFVKGRHAGRCSQLCEWIAGRLAQELNLPIATFVLAYVPEELLDHAESSVRRDLGAGWVFASRRQAAKKFNFSTIAHVPLELQQLVFAFDWWIANADRTLSQYGGNPNLLWEPGDKPKTGQLLVIDHNQAFDPDFSKADFINTHVFSEQGQAILSDAWRQQQYTNKFILALRSWQNICDAIPAEWWFFDEEMTLPSNFKLGAAYQQLMRCTAQDFWTVL